MNYGNGTEIFFGATWPELTDVFTVTVNDTGKEPSFDTGMVIQNAVKSKESVYRPIDAEIDMFYYEKSQSGYEFKFKPS